MLNGAAHDLGTDLLVTLELEVVDGLAGAEQRNAATRHDALFNRRARGVEGVFDAGLLFLHFNFGGGTDVDNGNAAGQLGEALLELLAVVVGGGFVDLAADLLHARLDVGGLARTFNDRGIFLVDHDALGATEIGDLDVLQLDAEVFGDALAAGEDCNVLEHRLAAIAEAGSLDRTHVERAADLVHDEGREGFAFHFLGNDEEGLARLGDGLEQREHVLEARDLLLVDQHVGVLEDRFHRLGIRGEVRGEVALVELHALNDVEGGLDGLGLFDGDGAVLADLIHGVGNDVADGLIPVGGDGGDLADFLAVVDLLGNARELGDGGLNGLVDAPLEEDRVGTRGHVLQTFAIDALGEDGCGGGAVTGGVARLGSDFLHHLRAHVLVGIGQFDFLGDGHAVFGDGGRAEFLVDDDIAALGAEGDFNRLGEQLDTAEDTLTSALVEQELFSSHVDLVSFVG